MIAQRTKNKELSGIMFFYFVSLVDGITLLIIGAICCQMRFRAIMGHDSGGGMIPKP
jgi:hypothetical protein